MIVSTRLSDEALVADPEPLRSWFDRELGGPSLSLTLERVSGGASNSLMRVTRGDRQFALRRPPAVSNDRTSHDLARELRLMRALKQTDVPCARLIEGTMDSDVIGGPFLVMQWISGFTPRDPMPGPFANDPANRRALGDAVIDALASIARVDWHEAGLSDFGKPEGFIDRQVDRWLSQFERNRVRDLPDLDQLVPWLRANRPSVSTPGLMHGDYSFANVMIAPDVPARVAAVIDWELATIGDPLLDLGHLLSSWEDETSGPTWASYIDWTAMRSRADAAERYAMASGRDVSALPFYMALALFRLAVILEGSFARHVRGQSDNERHGAFRTRVPELLTQAVRLIDREG
ncbi:phosphotransferase family protein [Croceicoccus sp. BE223]|uniref:phosphotransferase family protein n=1 Tax=Croceicoccus sp. BE223 TaxID=2817716 RepID=UPI00286B4B80|nr:phosphotransferase family protein [Croceicoccus sp. BE223]